MILGVTGFLGSGKDTVAEYLVQKGFKHISLSDFLREELKKRKLPVTRKNLQDVGNELRSIFGAGVLAQKAVEHMNSDDNYVVTSIRTRAEVLALQQKKDFVLVFVDAPALERAKRLRLRNREGDPKTLEELKNVEGKEMKGKEGSQQLLECRRLSNTILRNNSSLNNLHKRIDIMIPDMMKKYRIPRPSWDEYFMGIMDSVAKRGTCDRGKAGCVIVKDKRILTTGYVGSPVGLPHCDDVGHLMHKVLNADGTTSMHCVRTIHAEQNAIAQAAKYGIPIDGSTVYVKMEPCRVCAMLLINAGIKRVVAKKRYHRAQDTRKMFRQAGVKLEVLEDETLKYANM